MPDQQIKKMYLIASGVVPAVMGWALVWRQMLVQPPAPPPRREREQPSGVVEHPSSVPASVPQVGSMAERLQKYVPGTGKMDPELDLLREEMRILARRLNNMQAEVDRRSEASMVSESVGHWMEAVEQRPGELHETPTRPDPLTHQAPPPSPSTVPQAFPASPADARWGTGGLPETPADGAWGGVDPEQLVGPLPSPPVNLLGTTSPGVNWDAAPIESGRLQQPLRPKETPLANELTCRRLVKEYQQEREAREEKRKAQEAANLASKEQIRKALKGSQGPMRRGIVVDFRQKGGWGFIREPGLGKDVFVARRDIEEHLPKGHPGRDAKPGDAVEYTRLMGVRGWYALHVHILQEEEMASEEPEWRRTMSACSVSPASSSRSTTAKQAQAAELSSGPATATQETQTRISMACVMQGARPKQDPKDHSNSPLQTSSPLQQRRAEHTRSPIPAQAAAPRSRSGTSTQETQTQISMAYLLPRALPK
ncbi:uncharacterized protein ACNLHF_011505 [Anomaloglossus baeobatrachus]|uniref:uncharacterized protein LOC142258684 n=1 Tax=Anomaloglossus baeobatrachus TaxID=238106 RepID=UPI003F508FB2